MIFSYALVNVCTPAVRYLISFPALIFNHGKEIFLLIIICVYKYINIYIYIYILILENVVLSYFCQVNLLRQLLTKGHNASKIFYKLYLFQVSWGVKFIILIG